MNQDMLIVAGGAIGIYKIIEPLFFKIWDKQSNHEEVQEKQISNLEKRCEKIEKDVVYLKENKVSVEAHNIALQKMNRDLTEVKSLLSEIKGILKGGEHGQKINY